MKHIFCMFAACVCVKVFGTFTSSDGCYRPFDDMPLIARRYRYLEVIGRAQSAIVFKAQVCIYRAEVSLGSSEMCTPWIEIKSHAVTQH